MWDVAGSMLDILASMGDIAGTTHASTASECASVVPTGDIVASSYATTAYAWASQLLRTFCRIYVGYCIIYVAYKAAIQDDNTSMWAISVPMWSTETSNPNPYWR